MFVERSDTAIDTCALMNIWQFGAKANNPHRTRTDFEVLQSGLTKMTYMIESPYGALTGQPMVLIYI